MDVFVSCPLFKSFSSVSFPIGTCIRDLRGHFLNDKGIPSVDFYVKSNGRLLALDDKIQDGSIYLLEARLCGGKGGFGSMLRALGAQIEKTTNREACRDLSGRRLRDVNHEKEMADWLKKQTERDEEKEQRRVERLQRKLAQPRHFFTDPDYEQQCHDLSERLEDSVLKGMQASSSSQVAVNDAPRRKRSSPNTGHQSTKKKCFWTGDLENLASSSEEEQEMEASATAAVAAAHPCTSTSGSENPCVAPASAASSSESSPSPADTPDTPAGRSSPSPADTPDTPAGRSSPSPADTPAVCSSAPCTSTEDDHQELPGSSSSQETTNTEADCTSQCTSTTGADSSSTSHCTTSTEADSSSTSHCTSTQQPQKDKDTVVVLEAAGSVLDPVVVEVDLDAAGSVQDLEALGLEALKAALTRRGMKCGGTLAERAGRLFSVKGLSPQQIDPALLAKPGKGKRK